MPEFWFDENVGEFYGAKRQKFWILAARAGILYPSQLMCREFRLIYCMIFENIFSKYKEHYKLTDRILFRCSIENLGEFYGAKRQKFWILAARAGILYPSPDAQEFCTPPPMRRNSVPLPVDVSGILYPSRQRCQEFCTPPVRSVRNSIPLPKNSIPPGSPK